MGAFEDAAKANWDRYCEIKHLAKEFAIEREPGYAHFRYIATTSNEEAMKLTSYDVALIADGGNLCFGGRSFSNDGKGRYTGVVHTD